MLVLRETLWGKHEQVSQINPIREKQTKRDPDQPILPGCRKTTTNDILNSAIVRDEIQLVITKSY